MKITKVRDVLNIPFDRVMSSEILRHHFYIQAKEAIAERDRLRAEVEALRKVQNQGDAPQRRIVACLNACHGLSTDDLEKTGLVSAVGYELIELEKQCAEIEAERDQLRAKIEALKPIHAMILNALNRDAKDGRTVRGEIAEELRAFIDTL